ncbi:hypothetical protein DPEC_G00155120 [Dallia pectoralis]|uniref:Uncharacterized protein n=1 Tax=Dallia pectoralis TaxID=75939 RepID=A0ACC2GKV7_DALPE|nr:hypothetical protein DPEC_G00155120 [Dallia pectoralis]
MHGQKCVMHAYRYTYNTLNPRTHSPATPDITALASYPLCWDAAEQHGSDEEQEGESEERRACHRALWMGTLDTFTLVVIQSRGKTRVGTGMSKWVACCSNAIGTSKCPTSTGAIWEAGTVLPHRGVQPLGIRGLGGQWGGGEWAVIRGISTHFLDADYSRGSLPLTRDIVCDRIRQLLLFQTERLPPPTQRNLIKTCS